jgi:hypothetical protein
VPYRGVNFPRPGSYGLNTQADIIEDDSAKWASLATNGVIDNSGKLTSRKDFVLQTAGFASTPATLYTHRLNAGTELVLSAAVGKIYSGISTLTERHDYSATSTTLNSWALASLTSKIFGFQKGVAPFVLNESTFAAEAFTGTPWTNTPNVCIAADGRLWVADDEAGSNSYTVWWSNLLDGKVWNAGDAGNLDVRSVWPKGQDSIVALAFLSGRLVIFGRSSILLYEMAADHNPANMSLTDTIENLGCIARDSVIVAGGDLYFLARDGYYKVPRLAQVTSLLSIQKVSALVADDFVASYASEDLTLIRAGYNPAEKFLVLTMPTGNKTWCFHVDRQVPGLTEGTTVPAVTYWTNTSVPFRGFTFDKDGNWYAAMTSGVGKYTGYTPSAAGSNYNLDFYTLWNSLQDETRQKHLKNIAMAIETDVGQTGSFRWQMDYMAGMTRTKSWTANSMEFDEAPGIGVIKGPLGGCCSTARFGFTTAISGDQVTLHALRVYAKPGSTKVR